MSQFVLTKILIRTSKKIQKINMSLVIYIALCKLVHQCWFVAFRYQLPEYIQVLVVYLIHTIL